MDLKTAVERLETTVRKDFVLRACCEHVEILPLVHGVKNDIFYVVTNCARKAVQSGAAFSNRLKMSSSDKIRLIHAAVARFSAELRLT